MRGGMRVTVAFLALTMLPAAAFAQAALSGVVKDGSGAVLPGVTVEASSPVLIERFVWPRPRQRALSNSGSSAGPYKVSFALSGFSNFIRDAVVLAGSGVTTINADMRVGAVSESITVSGETPAVDVQTSTRRQVVLRTKSMQEIPASRGYGNVLATVPGIQATTLDISSGVTTNFFTARGGRGNEGRSRSTG